MAMAVLALMTCWRYWPTGKPSNQSNINTSHAKKITACTPPCRILVRLPENVIVHTSKVKKSSRESIRLSPNCTGMPVANAIMRAGKYPADILDPLCSGDMNGDGSVGVDDLLAIIADWGSSYDVDDLLLIIQSWGECD
jgi:hypothetical protein